MAITAVLPLCIQGSYSVDDLGRTEILFATFSAFNAAEVFSEFLIVCPPDEVDIIRRRTAKWSEFSIRVMSEEVLIPEFEKHRHVRGWRKQQIVKLAAPRAITTPYYLTLDADAICLRPLTESLLLPGGKALIQYEQRAQHPKWWKSSARILKMSGDVGNPELGMTVTPALMASDISEATGEEIAANLRGKGSWVDKLCGLHNPKSPTNWTLYRHRRGRWTEYSLYYLTAHKRNMLEQYHVDACTAENPQALLIHDSHPFEAWQAEQSFAPNGHGLFCVVNSSMRFDNNLVWDKIAPFIPGPERKLHAS